MNAALNSISSDKYNKSDMFFCAQCKMSGLCSSGCKNLHLSHDLSSIISKHQMVSRGEYLFQEHRPFKSLFAIRSGSFKTYSENANGEVQIIGIYLPGDIIGLDSTNTNTYKSSAKALEASSICSIPFNELELLAAKKPQLQHYFFALMSEEIKRSQVISFLLSKKSSEGRIASLLLDLSERLGLNGSPAEYFRIPISRIDIGNYLGLAVETVSRVFTRFQNNGLIELNGREVVLTDRHALTETAKHNV